MLIVLLGSLCAFLGVTYLVCCFLRLDSNYFMDRVHGNPEKISNLRSLQAAWDKLGRLRQFLCSSYGFLVIGIGLLLFSYDKSFAKYYLAVPALYAINLAALFQINKQAKALLDSGSHGDSQVLRVIKLNMRMCVTFSIVYIALVGKL